MFLDGADDERVKWHLWEKWLCMMMSQELSLSFIPNLVLYSFVFDKQIVLCLNQKEGRRREEERVDLDGFDDDG